MRMIVDIVSHDYESFQMIEKELSDWASEKGIKFSEAQFRNALDSAVQHGLVRAFKYELPTERFEVVPWDASMSEGFFYLATEQGRANLQ
jgi:hypothetical protein